jgi:hypothetical protein
MVYELQFTNVSAIKQMDVLSSFILYRNDTITNEGNLEIYHKIILVDLFDKID